jgi:Cu-Zn family superoxide dismutase
VSVSDNRFFLILAVLALPGITSAASTEQVTVEMNAVTATGIGESVGIIVISKAAHGVVLTPMLSGLPPGAHGFHVHEVADCSPAADDEGKAAAAQAAGAHLDPENTDQHGSPLVGDGHQGDLPLLMVDVAGQATTPIEASRLGMADLDNRALLIHSGGDNYSDTPLPNGGGGERIACGIIDTSPGAEGTAQPGQ